MELHYSARAKNFDPNRADYAWYVKFSPVRKRFEFCVVDPKRRRYDVAQGHIDSGAELPDNVKQAALERAGFYPSYVRWK